jgi:hypothetical protein
MSNSLSSKWRGVGTYGVEFGLILERRLLLYFDASFLGKPGLPDVLWK